MEPFVSRFIRASLVWLCVGVLIGVAMAVGQGAALAYLPAHVHALLLGFVAMMIYGVAYHVLPRFTGKVIHSRRLAMAQVWIANAGLACFVAGFIARVHFATPGRVMVACGGILSAASALAFAYNAWRTLDGKPAMRAAPQPVAMGGAPRGMPAR
jgi:cbb3-type cytochrome oxidase subunit 1